MEKIELEKILTPGSLIRTKHGNSQWISNIIHAVKGNCIQIELKEEYIKNIFFVGDRMTGKYFSDGTEYLIEGTIDNIDITDVSRLSIVIDKINTFNNLRGNNRFDIHMISKVSISRNPPVYCIVTNVSSSGVSLLSKTEFELDADAYVEVFINTGVALNFNGKIMRKSANENGFEHGIKITEIDHENQESLTALINYLQRQDHKLINTYLTNFK